jgi:hypothetical protein
MDEGPRLLLERLTSMYGVRVPMGNSRASLDGVVGTSPLTIPIGRPPVAGLSEFAREIVVSVSKRELFVNDYRVGEVECTRTSGLPCEEGGGTGEAITYRVRTQEGGGAGGDQFVLPVLLKQLQHFQKGRSTFLSVMDDRVGSWLMDCDAYTLAMDRDIPFGIAVMLVHTAGFADLTMARLAVVDENDSLNYIPLPSPRFDRGQRRTFHLVGDEWWSQEMAAQTVDFPHAFLAYSASLYPETFSGVEDPAIPSCLPPDVMWDRVAEDGELSRQAATQLLEYIDRLVAERPVILGRQPPAPLTLRAGGLEALPEVASEADDRHAQADEAGAHDADVRSSDSGAAPEVVIPGGLVVFPGPDGPQADGGAEPPADGSGRTTAESPLVTANPLVAQVFLQGAGFRVVLRSLDGGVSTAVDVPLSEPDRLYHYLALASGSSVQFSAAWETPMEKVVAAIDMLRYRCSVYAMSGRCRQWIPVKPHVLLFAVPGDRFSPMPAPTAGAAGDGAAGAGAAPEGNPAGPGDPGAAKGGGSGAAGAGAGPGDPGAARGGGSGAAGAGAGPGDPGAARGGGSGAAGAGAGPGDPGAARGGGSGAAGAGAGPGDPGAAKGAEAGTP